VLDFTLHHPRVCGFLAGMTFHQDLQIEQNARFALVVLECQKHYETGTDGKTLLQRILDNAKKDGEPIRAIQEIQENILLIWFALYQSGCGPVGFEITTLVGGTDPWHWIV
jgi:hypothetical protein